MGTNYYLRTNNEDLKSLPREYYEENSYMDRISGIHIGKSSRGWCFSLHVYPPTINNLEDWKNTFNKGQIFDENGDSITIEDMIDIITNRSHKYSIEDSFEATNKFFRNRKIETIEDYLRYNNAVRGPNNLLRSEIDNYCIGHGEGPYDYIVGAFS